MKYQSLLPRFANVLIPVMFIVTFSTDADSPRHNCPFNGHLYQRIDREMTWTDADGYCRRAGGHLVTITSARENGYVYSALGIDGVNIWIGATDAFSEGKWQWVTGERWGYDNWSKVNRPQPDDAGVGQDYAIFWDLAPGTWDDNGLPHGDFRNVFICEWEPAL